MLLTTLSSVGMGLRDDGGCLDMGDRVLWASLGEEAGLIKCGCP